jgi:amino acid permease
MRTNVGNGILSMALVVGQVGLIEILLMSLMTRFIKIKVGLTIRLLLQDLPEREKEIML